MAGCALVLPMALLLVLVKKIKRNVLQSDIICVANPIMGVAVWDRSFPSPRQSSFTWVLSQGCPTPRWIRQRSSSRVLSQGCPTPMWVYWLHPSYWSCLWPPLGERSRCLNILPVTRFRASLALQRRWYPHSWCGGATTECSPTLGKTWKRGELNYDFIFCIIVYMI